MELSGCPTFLSDWLIRPTLSDVSMLSLQLKKQFNVQLKRVSVNLPCLHLSTFLFSHSGSHKSVLSLLSPNLNDSCLPLKKCFFHIHRNKTSFANLPVVEEIEKNHSSFHQSCHLLNLMSFQIPLSTNVFLTELSCCSKWKKYTWEWSVKLQKGQRMVWNSLWETDLVTFFLVFI